MSLEVVTRPSVRGRFRIKRSTLIANLEGFLFTLPWSIGFLVLVLGPMIASLYLSLTAYVVVQPPKWIGLSNYSEALHDSFVPHSLWVTTLWAVGSVPINLLLGLALALLLNQKVKAMAFWRTAYYLPAVVSGVAVALLWQWMFDVRFGVINYLLKVVFGVQGPNWLRDPKWALSSFIIMSLWTVGGSMLINLAGLQGIPTTLYEAAEIDGAGSWRKFWHVTIPMMSPVILFNLVIGIINALQSFTYFYIMTRGGPDNATLTFMLYLYRTAFEYSRMGYGCALAWILFAYLGILTILVFKWSSGWVYYEAAGR